MERLYSISNNYANQSSDSLFCEAELITTANTAFSALFQGHEQEGVGITCCSSGGGEMLRD